MPGTHHELTATSIPQVILLLSELMLFWSVVVLHVLRLLSGKALPDNDPQADLAHITMGVAMACMLFPGAPAALDRPAAAAFLGIAAVFTGRAVFTRPAVFARPSMRTGPAGRRGNDLAIAVTSLAMVLMPATGDPSGTRATPIIAAFLLACAATHTRTLLAVHRLHGPAIDPGRRRLLLLAPHLSTIAMTLTMAYLFAAF